MKKLLTLAIALVFAASVYAAEFPTSTIGDLKASMSSQKIVLLDANGTDSWQAGQVRNPSIARLRRERAVVYGVGARKPAWRNWQTR